MSGRQPIRASRLLRSHSVPKSVLFLYYAESFFRRYIDFVTHSLSSFSWKARRVARVHVTCLSRAAVFFLRGFSLVCVLEHFFFLHIFGEQHRQTLDRWRSTNIYGIFLRSFFLPLRGAPVWASQPYFLIPSALCCLRIRLVFPYHLSLSLLYPSFLRLIFSRSPLL